MPEENSIEANPMRNWLALGGFLAICFLVSGIGGWVTATSVGTWYETLEKPAFNPPDWVFGPVWTALYIMIAVAGWLVWRKAGFSGAKPAFIVYFVQLGLNLLWSFLFFGAQNPAVALAGILALLASIVATALLFSRIDRVAAMLFLPYAAWVAFASVLNGSIAYLN